ncbi:MAG: septum formation initiator family protein [Fusobacteriaceae bacterium]|jgi:cell division protein FtsB|nr:septum formation initiator family protein [Fusobacteriaceae bacterium]
MLVGKDSGKNKHYISTCLLIGIAAIIFYRLWPEMYKSAFTIKRLMDDRDKLNERILAETKKLDICLQDIEKLNTMFHREKLARNRLRMVKKGEVIYKLIEEGAEKE